MNQFLQGILEFIHKHVFELKPPICFCFDHPMQSIADPNEVLGEEGLL